MNDSIPFSAAPLRVTVRSLHARDDGAEVVLQVLLESGEHREQKSLPLTLEQYRALKPARGVISEETYEQLEEASQMCRALRSGENLLSFGANSVQALARKLVQRGYSRDVALSAAQKLQERGLINEQADLSREVEKCLRKLWGAKRIHAYLWTRGFDSTVMAGLPALLESVDFADRCAALIRKHYGELPTDIEERRRVTAFLSRYGYSLSEIRSAFRML